MPCTSKRTAAQVPFSILPIAVSKVSGAGRRSCSSRISSSWMPSASATISTMQPQPPFSMPGWSSGAAKSSGRPKPK